MNKLTIFLAIIILTSLNLGCKKQEKEQVKPSPSPAGTPAPTGESQLKKENAVAIVDGVPLYAEDLRGERLDNAITNEILYQEALRQGLDKKYEKQVELFKKKMVTGAIISEILNNTPNVEEVTDEDIERFYKENMNRYQNIRVVELSTDDQKVAGEIEKEAEKGEDFEKISSEFSTPARNYMINAKRFQEIYGKAADKVEVGSVIAAKQDDKYKILKIVHVTDIPISKARQTIYFAVKAQKKQAAINGYVDKIKQENNVRVEIPGEGKSN